MVLERRHSDLRPPAPPQVIGRARVRAKHARRPIALDNGSWYDFVEKPADVLMPQVEGCCSIPLNAQPRHIWAGWLKIQSREESASDMSTK
jgi:hypothetical protein